MNLVRLRLYQRSERTRQFGRPAVAVLRPADVDRLREALRVASTQEAADQRLLQSLHETPDGIVIDVAVVGVPVAEPRRR